MQTPFITYLHKKSRPQRRRRLPSSPLHDSGIFSTGTTRDRNAPETINREDSFSLTRSQKHCNNRINIFPRTGQLFLLDKKVL
jgi:hypothetical protein